LTGRLRRVELVDAERLLYPVVPVVVTSESQGRVGGMLAAWWTQLSFKPFLVGVAIAPERFTYRLIVESKAFALNLLDFSYVERTPFLGDVSERFYKNKISKAGFTIVKGEVLGAPIIAEASAALEVSLVKIVETGDHDLFVGEVKAAYAIEDFTGMWTLKSYKPLMYLGRTRRPEPVKRVYVTCRDFEIKPIDYAPGHLEEYSKLRLKVLEEIEKAVRDCRDNDRLRVISDILEKLGLDVGDAPYYLEELKRRGI